MSAATYWVHMWNLADAWEYRNADALTVELQTLRGELVTVPLVNLKRRA